MVALGFGKFARADRIYALERITGEERGDGRRTRVWIDGVTDPLIASRTEITILRDMGQENAIQGRNSTRRSIWPRVWQLQRTRVAWTSTTSGVGRDAFSPLRLHPNRACRDSQLARGSCVKCTGSAGVFGLNKDFGAPNTRQKDAHRLARGQRHGL
jgi:hypothetical protein